jgi:hypothetical protein
MTAVYRVFSSVTAVAFAAALSAGADASSASLCNASGKVEVLSEQLDLTCAGGVTEERQALMKARAAYQTHGLDWQTRALINAKIERRLKQLNREVRKSRS